jgi:hypothetical protein
LVVNSKNIEMSCGVRFTCNRWRYYFPVGLIAFRARSGGSTSFIGR